MQTFGALLGAAAIACSYATMIKGEILQAAIGKYPGYSGNAPSGTFSLLPNGVANNYEYDYEYSLSGLNPVLKVDSFTKYVSYKGTLGDGITGKVYFEQMDDGALKVNYDLTLNEAGATGGLHIHTGKDCAAEAGAHWWDATDGLKDQWTGANGATYTSDANKKAKGHFIVTSGYMYKDNIGHTVVLHAASGTKIACGILVDSPTGVHVHTGTSCAVAANVGGHYYELTNVTVDPWTTTYSSARTSVASGKFTVADGYAYEAHVKHAVVVHSGNGGTRIGCGLLALYTPPTPPTTFLAATLGAYPGAVGNGAAGSKMVIAPFSGNKLNYEVHVQGVNPVLKVDSFTKYVSYTGTLGDGITGKVYFEQMDDGGLKVNYDLTLNEANATGGLHIHAGKDCAAEAGAHWWQTETFGTAGGAGNGTTKSADPWNTITTYTSDANKKAKGGFSLSSGYMYKENIGHTVVLHAASGAKIACGILVESPAGVHVHTGTSCAVADNVGGHYYDKATLTADPWTTTYSPAGASSAMTKFTLDDGYDINAHDGHAVVVHSGNGGARIACGVLALTSDKTSATTTTPASATATAASFAGLALGTCLAVLA